MKFCKLTQTGMKSKKIRNGVSRVRSHRQRRTGRLLRERGTIACSQFEREHLSALTNDHARKEEPEAKTTEQAKEGESQRHTHAVVVGRQEKGAGSDLGAVFSSSLLLGSWLGQSPPLLPLPRDHFVLSPLLPCQCSYLCIKWTNHRGGKNDIWLCWKVQKTLINGDAIKLTRRVFWCFIRVICCYISTYLIKFQYQQKSLVLVTLSLPLANYYSTCTKEEAE